MSYAVSSNDLNGINIEGTGPMLETVTLEN
jgi:hypothetical protein